MDRQTVGQIEGQTHRPDKWDRQTDGWRLRWIYKTVGQMDGQKDSKVIQTRKTYIQKIDKA